jgi:hypothetical protein
MNTVRTTSSSEGVAVALALVTLVLAACQSGGGPAPRPGPGPGANDLLDQQHPVISQWSETAYDAFVAEDKYGNPMAAVRVLAMVHLAQHDALAAIRPAYGTYALSTTDREPDADPVAAAASAAFEVLVAAMPKQRPLLQERLEASLAGRPDTPARASGVALGQRAAVAIAQRRENDGSNTALAVPVGRDASARPGLYRAVAPFDFMASPGWRHLTPFGLQNPQQFRVPPPPALDSDLYATAFEEVKKLGRKGSKVRTAEQTAYAKFWYEFSDIGWNRVARVVAADRKLGLQATARLFALVNMAMSDAYVSGWDSKLHHDFWRPTTAIRDAERDGNPATAADATWESEEVVPPVHDYPSTHSALGNAAAEVLAHVFGDATPFTMTSTSATPAGGTRSFRSFSQAADENADSRVQGGLHFRFSCEAGQALGRQVGAWVVATALRPQSLLSQR